MESSQLRKNLPFRRIALVLSGGGAFGAYEVGVLRALESLGLKPGVIAGVSVGAINALIWVAHGFRSDALHDTWSRLTASSLGIRWTTLAARALGAFVIVLAIFEALTALANLPPLHLFDHSQRVHRPFHLELQSLTIETLAWAVVAGFGLILVLLSPQLEDLLIRLHRPQDPGRAHRWFSRTLLVLAVAYVAASTFEIAWPRRVHATVLGVGALIWLLTRHPRTGDGLRHVVLRLFPETRGRGLWRSGGRRRLIEELIAGGVPERLTSGDPHLIISACAIESGRMHYFINWPNPSEAFRRGVGEALGEVTPVLSVEALLDAVVASSAVPVVFEPERINGVDFLDGGVFSNQPLHAVMADGADAVLLVLVSPAGSPPRLSEDPTLMDVAARLPQLANWRDLQAELRRLPEDWRDVRKPARVCVVEPIDSLPGSSLGFDPKSAAELMKCGESDAWSALERAGWIEPANDPTAATGG